MNQQRLFFEEIILLETTRFVLQFVLFVIFYGYVSSYSRVFQTLGNLFVIAFAVYSIYSAREFLSLGLQQIGNRLFFSIIISFIPTFPSDLGFGLLFVSLIYVYKFFEYSFSHLARIV